MKCHATTKHANSTSIRMTASATMLRLKTHLRLLWNSTIAKINRELTELDIATRAFIETLGLLAALAFGVALPAYLFWCWLTS